MAIYPIVGYYSYGFATVGDFLLLLLVLCVVILKKRVVCYKPLLFFLSFVVLHEIILALFIGNVSQTFINSLLISIFYVLSIICLSSVISFERFVNAYLLVCFICMLGMFYHVAVVYRGGQVSPIQLPFLPQLSGESRFAAELNRPTSFFPEPSTYAAYMLIALYLTIIRKYWVYAILISFSLLLSSSTTGILLAGVLWISCLCLEAELLKKMKYVVPVLFVFFVMIFLKSNLFEVGRDKLVRTNFEQNIRVAGGIAVYKSMDAGEIILGIPKETVAEYIDSEGGVSQIYKIRDGRFVSSFWLAFIKYGVIGGMLFLFMYLRFYKKERLLRPYLITVIILMFTETMLFNALFVFQWVFMIAYSLEMKQQVIKVGLLKK